MGENKTTKKVASQSSATKRRARKMDFKTWIMMGVSAVALALVIVAILNFARNEKFDSSYFHNDEKKIVLTMDKEIAALDNSIYEPYITHVVYYRDGDRITGVRAFYEYISDEEARKAYPNLSLGDFANNKKISGRFVVFQVKEAQYKDVTVETLEENIKLLNEIDALILDYNEETIKDYGELILEEESVEAPENSDEQNGDATSEQDSTDEQSGDTASE